METADAVVIGGGLNGAATAFFLLKKGLRRVLIIDADNTLSGASGAAVGLLRTHYDNRPETELAAISMPYFSNWSEMIGGDCGWRNTGFYRFVEPDQIENMNANIRFQHEFGVTTEILDADLLSERAPAFNNEGIGAVLFEPDAGTSSNSKATTSLLKHSCMIGGELHCYRRATTIHTENGRVKGIGTDKGDISTSVVVLAAGFASRKIAATAGIDIPLEAKAITVADIAPPENLRIPGCFMDPMTNSWISVRQQGRAIISAPYIKAGKSIDADSYEIDFPREYVETGLAAVERRLPGIEQSRLVNWWLRPECFAPDGKPVIGGINGLEGLFVNTAGAGKGHKVAPAIAIGLSELITQGVSTTVDLAPFTNERFSKELEKWGDNEYRQRIIG